MANRLKKNQIIILLLFLSIFANTVSFFSYHKAIEKIEVDSFKKSVRDRTKTRLEYTKGLISDMIYDLKSTSVLIEKYDSIWNSKVKDIIDISNSVSMFSFISVVDKSGKGYSNDGSSIDVSNDEYFKSAMEGAVSFSEVRLSKRLPGKYIQIFAYPIQTKDNCVNGVVLGVIDLDKLRNHLENKNKKARGNLYIIDSNGNYISRFQRDEFKSENSNLWKDIKTLEKTNTKIENIQDDFDNRREGEFSFCEGGVCKYACYMPIGTKKWQLMYTVKDTEIDKKLDRILKIDITYTVITTICQLVWIFCIIWYFHKANKEVNKANQEVNKNIEILQTALERSKQPIFEYNQNTREMILKTNFLNPLFQENEKVLLPENLIENKTVSAQSKEEFLKLFEEIKTKVNCNADIQIHFGSKLLWLRISLYNIYKQDKIYMTVGFMEDITEIKEIEQNTKNQLELQDILVVKSLLYAKVDLLTEKLLEVNGKRTSYSYEVFLSECILKYVNEIDAVHLKQELSLRILMEKSSQGVEVSEKQFQMNINGKMRWVSCMLYCNALKRSKLMLIINDIDRKKREEIDLQYRAERDGLTGLYNAATAHLKIKEALVSGFFSEEKQVLLLLDLDNYKQINDTFGHSYGDKVLKDVATILKSRFRSSDIIGRIGGDEFIILLRNIRSYSYTETLIKQLCNQLNITYEKNGKKVSISASVGVSKIPVDGETYTILYEKADAALYKVKKKGKNNFSYYE